MDRLLKRIAPAAKVDSPAAEPDSAAAAAARWTVLGGVCDSALQCGELWKIPAAAESDSAVLGETTPVLNRAAGPLDSDQNLNLEFDPPAESDSALEALVEKIPESQWIPEGSVRWTAERTLAGSFRWTAEQHSAELTREHGEQLAANWTIPVDSGDSSGE